MEVLEGSKEQAFFRGPKFGYRQSLGYSFRKSGALSHQTLSSGQNRPFWVKIRPKHYIDLFWLENDRKGPYQHKNFAFEHRGPELSNGGSGMSFEPTFRDLRRFDVTKTMAAQMRGNSANTTYGGSKLGSDRRSKFSEPEFATY